MKKLLMMIGVAAVLPSFGANWNGVSSGFMSNGDNWIGGTAPTTGNGLTFINTLGRTLFVTNDISYKLGDTTVANGSWAFASTSTFLSGNALLVGNANETVSIVNYADWTCAYYFAIANDSNSTVVFTNRAGTIICKGNGSGSPMPGVTIGGRYNQEATFTGTSGELVFEGGTLTCAKAFEVGYGKNCTGVFEQTGGTITADRLGIANTTQSTATGARGTVLLKGGTFATQRIAVGSGSGGSVTFDGGTLQLTSSHSAAIQDSAKLAVNVGAGGGTISLADGVVSTIPASISSAVSGGTDGGLKIMGGGRLVFTGALSYTGATTVEVGTTVVFADPSSIGGGLAVTIPETPPDVGVYTVFLTTGDGTLEEAFAAATLPAGDANARFRLSADKKSILCLYGDVAQEWIGGATGSLGDAANWSTGVVPTDGNAVISSGAAATLASSAAFTPDAITFPSGTAQITISGDAGISGLLAVTNEASGVHHVFECPVSFAANAEADISCGSGTYVKFAGGMTAYTLKQTGAEAYISGDITLTKDIANWARYVEIDYLHLVDAGTRLTIPHSVSEESSDNTPNFYVSSDTTLFIQGDFTNVNARASGGPWGGFVQCNAGTVEVSGRIVAAGKGSSAANAASTGVFKAKGLVNNAPANYFCLNVEGNSTMCDWAVGSDGISNDQGSGFYIQNSQANITLHAMDDFAIDCDINIGTTKNGKKLVLDTNDYNDPAIARKITVNGVLKNTAGGYLEVTGIGEVVFNSVSTFVRGTVVSDSATLAVNDGCKPGNGAVTMNGTSTLKVAQSGTVTLGGNLTLTANAALAFNFTERATAPVLSASSATVSGDTVNVKVSAADGIRPKGGTHTLTSGIDFTGKTVNLVEAPDWVQSVGIGGGNIVLTVKPVGLIIMIQ